MARTKGRSISVEVDTEVSVCTDVDLDLDQFVAGLDDEDAVALQVALNARLGTSHNTSGVALLEDLYIAVSRGDATRVMPLAREVVRELGGRVV